jgi:hypothetical protein
MRDSLGPRRCRPPRSRRRQAVLLVAATVVLGAGTVLRPPVAGAGVAGSDGPGGTVSVGASGSGSQPGWPGSGAEGEGAGIGSTASPWVCTDTPLTLNDESQPPGGPLPGGWFSITCVNLATGSMETTTEWITQAAGQQAAPGVDPRLLAIEAERSLVRLVADDIEPLDSVHPSTLELYRSLSRRRHRGDHALSSRRSRT